MLARASTAKYQNLGKHEEILALLGSNDSLARLNKQQLAWRDKLATNKFCYHGDRFKQTRLSTGETQARMDRERGSVCLWICEDVGDLLENTAGSKLMYINCFSGLNMALISEQKKTASPKEHTERMLLWLDWEEPSLNGLHNKTRDSKSDF